MRLGVDCYSLRWQGWDAYQLIDYSARLKLDVCHFGRNNLASLDEAYLLSLKRHGEQLGVSIEVGMNSFDKYSSSFRPEEGTGEEQLAKMLRAAKVVGSPSVRCFLGSQNERSGPVAIEQHIEECIRTLKAVAPVARDLGVKVAVENHGGIDLLAREMRALVEAAGPDYVGVCLDTGNPVFAAEDPVVTTELLANYTVTSHVRDNRVWATPEGAMVQWVPMGTGNTDLRQIVKILAEQAPKATFNLEIISGMAPRPLPYFDPESEFWRMYPNMLARDFARFVAMAQDGRPGALEQVVVPPGSRGGLPEGELGAALVEQQRQHLEASVAYSREVLGVGERDRS